MKLPQKIISLSLATSIMAGTISCGTLIYPERRGQLSGRIDVGVALLDGLGVLCFFVPGVIAFAVDFSTGAIYLPGGASRSFATLSDLHSLRENQPLQLGSGLLNKAEIEAQIAKQTGVTVDLQSPTTKVAKAPHISQMENLTWASLAETLTPKQLAALQRR